LRSHEPTHSIDVCFPHLICSNVTKKCHEIYYQSLVPRPRNVALTNKKKESGISSSINELDGEMLSEYAWNLSHGPDTCDWANLPIRRRPSVHVFSLHCPALHPSPFHWRLQEHKLAANTLTSRAYDMRPVLLLSWTWSVCLPHTFPKDFWTTGISLLCDPEWCNCKLTLY
jgi:hypothetical protein